MKSLAGLFLFAVAIGIFIAFAWHFLFKAENKKKEPEPPEDPKRRNDAIEKVTRQLERIRERRVEDLDPQDAAKTLQKFMKK